MEEDYSQPTQPTQPEVPKPQEGISTVTGILITLLAAALIGAGIWYYYTYVVSPDLDKSATTTTTPTKTETDKTAGWKTLTLAFSKGTLKYPKEWVVENIRKGDVNQPYAYQITDNSLSRAEIRGQDTISEYDIKTWLTGPTDVGYVLSSSERKSALAVMKEIYQTQKITDETIVKLAKFHLEFFPYSGTSAIDWKYIESKDGKSRGFSCINTSGQDYAISADYIVSLYNPDKNIIVSISQKISDESKEIKALNDKLYDTAGKQVSNATAIDKTNHTEFKASVEGSKRADLSFGDYMDKADLIMKSLTF